MNLSKIGAVLFTAMCTLLLPFSTAFASGAQTAGAGEWDKLGTYTYIYSSKPVYSSGGDFRVCLSSSAGFSLTIHLYEDDPGSNQDEYVGANYFSPGECHTFKNIGKFVDGDNRKAEFYAYDYSGKYVTVTFYD
ncbi:hypothetical protein ACH95_18445 [Bacillus glycinifermentans]|nr:hypothetical protein ACH95_18445 [Bacillus glycinifermentans]